MDQTEIKKWNKKVREPFSKVKFFEEGHIYEIEGVTDPVKSVSSLLKYFYEEFPAEEIAPKWGADRGFTSEEVLMAWEGEGLKATTHGTKVHLIGEDYVRWKFLGEGSKPDPICKQSLGAMQFINDLPDYLVPIAVELVMYNSEYHFTGMCDGVILNTRNNKLILYDYKTNNTLIGPYGKEPLFKISPDHGLTQNNLGKYNLQLNFYRFLVEAAGFQVQTGVIVHLEEDKYKKKLYKTYKIVDLQTEIIEFLDTREHLN